jgi:hypothetical protein
MKAWIGRVPDTWHEAMLPYRHVFFFQSQQISALSAVNIFGDFSRSLHPGSGLPPN